MRWSDQEKGWDRPLLVVGEANPYGVRQMQSGTTALFPHPASSSGARLKKAAGYNLREFLYGVHRVNLLDEAPDNNWSNAMMSRAKDRVAEIIERERQSGNRTIFLLGRRVRYAFDMGTEDSPWFEEFFPTWARRVVLMPHPSGRSTVWNNPAVIREVGRHFDILRPHVVEHIASRGQL
jgi:hypothetical protein